MNQRALLAAVDTAWYNRGLSIVQWGVTGVGVAMLLVAAVMLLQKAKPDASPTLVRVQRIVGAVLAVVGVGIIAYAWLGFSSL